MTNNASIAILGLISALVVFLFMGAVLAATIVSGVVYRQTHRPGSIHLLIGFAALLLMRACAGAANFLLPLAMSYQRMSNATNLSTALTISAVIQSAAGIAALGLIVWGIFKYLAPTQPTAISEIEGIPS